MDRSDLIARVRKLSGANMEALWSHRAVGQEVNEAYQEVLGLEDWPFLYAEATVAVSAGASAITLPTAMRNITSLRLDGEDRLRQSTVAELDRLEDPGPGQPAAYARIDNATVRLWPTPGQAYTISVRGWEAPAPLERDTDQPVFDVEFRPIIAYAAAIKILDQEEDDSGRSERYQRDAGALLQRMRDRYVESHDTGIVQMGGRRSRPRRWRL